MACQYVYAGSEPMTYEELLKLLEDEEGLEKMAALLYSKDDSQFQAQLLKKIENDLTIFLIITVMSSDSQLIEELLLYVDISLISLTICCTSSMANSNI